MSTEVAADLPPLGVFLSRTAFEDARNQGIIDISVNLPGFLAAMELVEFEPSGAPLSIVIGAEHEVLPFLSIDDTEILSTDMLGAPNPQSFMLHGLEDQDNEILSFYVDKKEWNTYHVSLGLAASMQSEDRRALRERSAMDIGIATITTGSSAITTELGAPWPVTGLIVAGGVGTLAVRRVRHRLDANYLIAARKAAAAHEPLQVIRQ